MRAHATGPAHFRICSDERSGQAYLADMPTYGQFCPVAKTAELLCERWMPLVLRELMCGSGRFSEIQHGVPTISPALLSKRLRQLVSAGVVERTTTARGGAYALTEAGWELYPLIEAMGTWGQRWARSDYGPDELDPSLLMWDMHRMLQPAGLAERRTVIEFWIRDAPPRKTTYWLVVDTDAVDLCLADPGQDVDLRVNAELRALTEVWMGDVTMPECQAQGRIEILGSPTLAQRFPSWLGRHPVLGGIERAVSGAPATH